MCAKISARNKIRTFFENNIGRVVTTHEIQEVAGISEYARRIRELRDQDGMQIKSHIDRQDLKPGEYILESLERVPKFGKDISPQRRSEILERNGFTCQLCGAGVGDPDQFNFRRKTRLHVDHIVPLSQGGTDDPANLRVLCSACNHQRSNIQMPSESTLTLIARIRRAPRSVQLEIYELLRRKFEPR